MSLERCPDRIGGIKIFMIWIWRIWICGESDFAVWSCGGCQADLEMIARARIYLKKTEKLVAYRAKMGIVDDMDDNSEDGEKQSDLLE
jgi:hypothetical protein